MSLLASVSIVFLTSYYCVLLHVAQLFDSALQLNKRKRLASQESDGERQRKWIRLEEMAFKNAPAHTDGEAISVLQTAESVFEGVHIPTRCGCRRLCTKRPHFV